MLEPWASGAVITSWTVRDGKVTRDLGSLLWKSLWEPIQDTQHILFLWKAPTTCLQAWTRYLGLAMNIAPTRRAPLAGFDSTQKLSVMPHCTRTLQHTFNGHGLSFLRLPRTPRLAQTTSAKRFAWTKICINREIYGERNGLLGYEQSFIFPYSVYLSSSLASFYVHSCHTFILPLKLQASCNNEGSRCVTYFVFLYHRVGWRCNRLNLHIAY
jgi:hypothetical protein